jgi:hypothetical protein
MKAYLISKGAHRPQRWWVTRFLLLRFLNTTSAKERLINFDVSWKNSDPNAWHKLFGFSRGFDHHINSARWVAKYNPKKDKMELGVYTYVNGVRAVKVVADTYFHVTNKLYLNHINNVFESSYYTYELNGKTTFKDGKPTNRIPTGKLPKFGWFLGLYHGGKNTSPNDLITWSNKYL